jgi:hypothetical protein
VNRAVALMMQQAAEKKASAAKFALISHQAFRAMYLVTTRQNILRVLEERKIERTPENSEELVKHMDRLMVIIEDYYVIRENDFFRHNEAFARVIRPSIVLDKSVPVIDLDGKWEDLSQVPNICVVWAALTDLFKRGMPRNNRVDAYIEKYKNYIL